MSTAPDLKARLFKKTCVHEAGHYVISAAFQFRETEHLFATAKEDGEDYISQGFHSFTPHLFDKFLVAEASGLDCTAVKEPLATAEAMDAWRQVRVEWATLTCLHAVGGHAADRVFFPTFNSEFNEGHTDYRNALQAARVIFPSDPQLCLAEAHQMAFGVCNTQLRKTIARVALELMSGQCLGADQLNAILQDVKMPLLELEPLRVAKQ